MKRGHQTNKQTNKQRNKHTSRLLDQLGPEGRVGENSLNSSVTRQGHFLSCINFHIKYEFLSDIFFCYQSLNITEYSRLIPISLKLALIVQNQTGQPRSLHTLLMQLHQYEHQADLSIQTLCLVLVSSSGCRSPASGKFTLLDYILSLQNKNSKVTGPRGGLHSVVSHNSFFANQEIRQLEL